MYKIPELIKKISLKEIPIVNQDKIAEATGSMLDLQKAYELIKEVSQDFKLYDERAIEADKLLSTIIEKHLSSKEPQYVLPLQEKPETASASRKRKLELIKLKLKLDKEKKSKTQK